MAAPKLQLPSAERASRGLEDILCKDRSASVRHQPFNRQLTGHIDLANPCPKRPHNDTGKEENRSVDDDCAEFRLNIPKFRAMCEGVKIRTSMLKRRKTKG